MPTTPTPAPVAAHSYENKIFENGVCIDHSIVSREKAKAIQTILDASDDSAALIVRSVNAFPALVAALDEMLQAFPAPKIRSANGMAGNLAHAAARTALALARKEQP